GRSMGSMTVAQSVWSYSARLIRHMKAPHELPKKVRNKLADHRQRADYDERAFTEEQTRHYDRIDLSRANGIAIHRKTVAAAPHLQGGMHSEHSYLLAALSAGEKRIDRILEIGTFDGRNAAILSRIFPDASITTVDLMDDDPVFTASYGRESAG